jgi:hypothetical protein
MMRVKPNNPNPLALSGRIYSLLLYAYPAPFRREYGHPMAQLFRDEARDTLQGSGTAGLIGLWFLTLFDLLKTAFAEHIWEVFHMPIQKLQRWSGPAAAIAGLLWASLFLFVVEESLGEVEENLGYLLFVPALLLMAVGLAGLYQRLPASLRLGSKLAFGVGLIGLLLILAVVLVLSLTGTDLLWNTLWVFFMAAIVGIACMGVIAISKRALGRLSFVPLAQAAFLLGMVLTMGDSGRDPALITFSVLFGFSWVLLGFALWSTGENAPDPALPA